MPIEYVAVISLFSIPNIPYFPELRSVSFTADHSVVHDTEYVSLCTFANEGSTNTNNTNNAVPSRFIRGSLLPSDKILTLRLCHFKPVSSFVNCLSPPLEA